MTTGRPLSDRTLASNRLKEIIQFKERLTTANEAATHWHTQWMKVRNERDVLLAMLMERMNVQSSSASK